MGRVAAPFGVKGWVKIVPFTAIAGRARAIPPVLDRPAGRLAGVPRSRKPRCTVQRWSRGWPAATTGMRRPASGGPSSRCRARRSPRRRRRILLGRPGRPGRGELRRASRSARCQELFSTGANDVMRVGEGKGERLLAVHRDGGEEGRSRGAADRGGLGRGLVGAIQFDCVTLFPQMFAAVTEHGITRRAREEGRWSLATWNPRDFTTDNHRTVDDRPYGGGPGDGDDGRAAGAGDPGGAGAGAGRAGAA